MRCTKTGRRYEINCFSHPPLNPLPSREGKERKELPSKEGGKERNPNQWRGIYPLEMGRNLIKTLLSLDYSVNGKATEMLEKGCQGFIQKPYKLREVSQKIKEVLDKKKE